MALSFTKPETLDKEVQDYLNKGGAVHDILPDGTPFVYWGSHKVYVVNGKAYRLKAMAKAALRRI